MLKTYREGNRSFIICVIDCMVIILYFIISYFVGKFIPPIITPDGEMSKEMSRLDLSLLTFINGIFVTSLTLLLIGVIIILIKETRIFIKKQIALYHYLYLPFSSEELNDKIKKGTISDNYKNYLEYINEQLIYNPKGATVQINKKDVFMLLRTIKSVYGLDEIECCFTDNPGYNHFFTYFKNVLTCECNFSNFNSRNYNKITLKLMDNAIKVTTYEYTGDEENNSQSKVYTIFE